MYSAVVLCAGKGSRSGLSYNKILYKIDEETVFEKTMKVFLKDKRCTQIIVVCKEEEIPLLNTYFNESYIEYVVGGKERQDSVYEGLKHVQNDYVMIHDGARPYITQNNLDALYISMIENDACLLMVPCINTIKEVKDNKVVQTLKRETLMQAQTPQCFLTSLILDAYRQVISEHIEVTDDASCVELTSDHEVFVVYGDYKNIKITTQEDL